MPIYRDILQRTLKCKSKLHNRFYVCQRTILKRTLRPNYFVIVYTRALCRCVLTIVKPDVKSRLCGRDCEGKKRRGESRNATQVLAKIQKREARATRSIARACESCSSAFWIGSIAPSIPLARSMAIGATQTCEWTPFN